MKHSERNSTFWAVLAFLAIFSFVSLIPPAYADKAEVDQINHAIKAKGGKWIAGETSVSKLSLDEKKRRLGHKDELDAEAVAPSQTLPETLTAISPTLDWRSVGGVNYVSPIKNQGSCGSCWAFAATAGLESQYMIATGSEIDLSEQILVSCSGAGTCSGGSSASASNYISSTGLPVETCLPYTSTNSSCLNACLDWQNDTYKVVGWHSPTVVTTRVDAIKDSLYTYGPVTATMYVYNDFYSYGSGVYSYSSGAYLGAHAVLVVGYDDVNQCFIVKNSWGTGWGEAGFFRIAYREVGGTSNFGYSVMAYNGYGSPTPPPPAPTPTCSYSLSSTSKTFKTGGGSASFGVYSQSGCNWSAASSAAWVHITAGAGGTGNNSVYYTVDANQGTSRSATISAGGLSYTVKQSGVTMPRGVKK